MKTCKELEPAAGIALLVRGVRGEWPDRKSTVTQGGGGKNTLYYQC